MVTFWATFCVIWTKFLLKHPVTLSTTVHFELLPDVRRSKHQKLFPRGRNSLDHRPARARIVRPQRRIPADDDDDGRRCCDVDDAATVVRSVVPAHVPQAVGIAVISVVVHFSRSQL